MHRGSFQVIGGLGTILLPSDLILVTQLLSMRKQKSNWVTIFDKQTGPAAEAGAMCAGGERPPGYPIHRETGAPNG